MTIRKCRYSDLTIVAEMIVTSFYTAKMRNSPFSAVLKLGELNRLQQNFPYADDQHFMFVATTTSTSVKKNDKKNDDTDIVGFVDLDFRPATRSIDPPRPYLSDLAVDPNHRRQGIATTLIQKCEALAQTNTKNKNKSLYIRVEQANDAAVQMYEQFQYQQMEHDVFGVEDTTVLLRKDFDDTSTDEKKEDDDDANDDDNMEQEDAPVLD